MPHFSCIKDDARLPSFRFEDNMHTPTSYSCRSNSPRVRLLLGFAALLLLGDAAAAAGDVAAGGGLL
jgi:hypothetical protein